MPRQQFTLFEAIRTDAEQLVIDRSVTRDKICSRGSRTHHTTASHMSVHVRNTAAERNRAMFFDTTVTGPCAEDSAGWTHRKMCPAAMSTSCGDVLNGSFTNTLVAPDSLRHLPSAVDIERGTTCSSITLSEPVATSADRREKELPMIHLCIPQQPHGRSVFAVGRRLT